MSNDKEVIVQKVSAYMDVYYLSVPKSKQRGSKYFLDKDLINLIGTEFQTSGGSMINWIKGRDKLKQVLDYLSEKDRVVVLKKASLEKSNDSPNIADQPTTPAGAEEGNVLYREESEEEAARLDAQQRPTEPGEKEGRTKEKSENDNDIAEAIKYKEDRSDSTEDVEAVNKRFNEELEKYQRGEVPIGTRFDLGMPSEVLESAGFPYLPISMRASLLSSKAGMERHPFVPSDLKDLVKAIQRPIAIFRYSKDNMRNLIVDVTHGNKNFLVGVTLDYKKGDIEVNSVSGLFPKDSHEWIKWIQDGKAIRIGQKKKVLDLIDSLRTNPAESERIGLNLSSVANIVENFDNPALKGENLSREGEGAYSDEELSLINEPVAKMLGKSQRTRKQRAAFAAMERENMEATVRDLAEKLHLSNVEINTTGEAGNTRMARAKGYFNKKTGKIVINVRNHRDAEDAKKTLLHEGVAHYGLRKLLGDKFEGMLDRVYANIGKVGKARIDASVKNGDVRTATEEYLAGMAEDMNFEEAKGEATRSGKVMRGLDYVIHMDKKDVSDHIVKVKIDGEDKCVFILGNPRAEQAMKVMQLRKRLDRGELAGSGLDKDYADFVAGGGGSESSMGSLEARKEDIRPSEGRDLMLLERAERLWEGESPYPDRSHPFCICATLFIGGKIQSYMRDAIYHNILINRTGS